MPAAIAVPLILGAASTGVSLYGAKQAGKASKEQVAAGEKALDLQRDLYQQTRSDLAPYRDQGGQGLTALTALLGLPAVAPGSSGSSMKVAGPTPTPEGRPNVNNQPGTDYAIPRGTWPQYAPTVVPPGGIPPPAGRGSPSAYAAAPPSALVTLRAPTGQTQAVPADQVDYYLARGATRG